MAVIYLRHPVHGTKVACSDMEAKYDRENGWEDFDPKADKPAVPDFLAPVESDLPDDFPGREELIKGGFATWESLVGKTSEELQLVKGIGPATAKAILDVMES